MQYPIVPVPGGFVRLDLVTHLTTVDTDPGYVEVFFLGGHRECFHHADIPQVLAWCARQAAQFARVQAFPRPSYDVRLEGLVHAEEGAPYGE